MSPFRPTLKRQGNTPVTEPVDDAALHGRYQVEQAKACLASLSPERRAELEREWL